MLEARTLLAGMPTLWTSHGPGGGGAFFEPVIAPNGQDLWVNSDMSGIYHSDNFGQNWQMIPFHNAAGGVSAYRYSEVVLTSDPNILYIADSRRGMVKSIDGGATWDVVSGWSDGSAYWMTADPANPNRLVVANWDKLYLSTNGGTSFAMVYQSPEADFYIGGVFWDGTTIYLGSSDGLLTSTSNGAGWDVSAVRGGQPILSFAGAKQGATTRLIALTTPYQPGGDTNPQDLDFGGLYRLDVGGRWTELSVPSGSDVRFVAMARNNISVAYLAGADINGMTQVFKTTNGGSTWTDVFRTGYSGDGATPNHNIHTGYEGLQGDFDYWWGGMPFGLSVAPNDANKAIISDYGFVHVTSDGGTFWHQAYTSSADENPPGAVTPKHKAYHGVGLEDTSTKWLQWTSSTSIFAGYTDTIGFRSTDGGASWATPTWNGLATNTVYQSAVGLDGKLYAATSNVHDMYMAPYLTDARCNPAAQTGRVIVSTDHGATWTQIHDFGHPVVWVQPDPANANRMYASVVDGPGSTSSGVYGGIWVTNNLNLGASSIWTKLPKPPRTEGHPYSIRILNDGAIVVSFSARRAGDPEAFTRSSGVFYSTNGGTTWQDRTLISSGGYGTPDMSYYTRDVMIDPTDPTQNTWYAGVFNGWGGKGNETGDVYRTADRGLNWTRMEVYRSSGYPSGDGINVQSVSINPVTREMYVTTDGSGMLYAPDARKSGLSYTDFVDMTVFPFAGPDRVFTNPYDGRDVWVTTFGGGLWRGGAGPDTVTATALGTTQIQVQWADNSANEAGFEIDRATNPAFTQNLVTTTAAMNATSTTITGLSPITTYYFRVRAVNGRQKSVNSAVASATTASDAPEVSSVAINQGASQRSLVRRIDVVFSEAVTLNAGAVTVKLSSGAAIPGVTVGVSNPSADQRSYILTFSGPSVVNGSLPDGVYDLVISAASVHDLDDHVMVANYTQRFHRLFGDSNGDRRVNLVDYRRVRLTLNRSSGQALFDEVLDYDGNGVVDALDLAQFRRRFGARFVY